MSADYARAEAKNLFMIPSEMDASAASTTKLSASKKTEGWTNAISMVHIVEKSSSCSEKQKVLNTIVGKISCLSALPV